MNRKWEPDLRKRKAKYRWFWDSWLRKDKVNYHVRVFNSYLETSHWDHFYCHDCLDLFYALDLVSVGRAEITSETKESCESCGEKGEQRAGTPAAR